MVVGGDLRRRRVGRRGAGGADREELHRRLQRLQRPSLHRGAAGRSPPPSPARSWCPSAVGAYASASPNGRRPENSVPDELRAASAGGSNPSFRIEDPGPAAAAPAASPPARQVRAALPTPPTCQTVAMAIDKRATRLGVLALVGILFSLIGARLWFLQTVERGAAGADQRHQDCAPSRCSPSGAGSSTPTAASWPTTSACSPSAVDWQVLRTTSRSRRDLPPPVGMGRRARSRTWRRASEPGVQPVPADADRPRTSTSRRRPRSSSGSRTSPACRSRGVAARATRTRRSPAHVVGYMGAITDDQKDEYRRPATTSTNGSASSASSRAWRRCCTARGARRLRGRRRQPARARDRARPADQRQRHPADDRPRPAAVRRAGARDARSRCGARSWHPTRRSASPTANSRRWIRRYPTRCLQGPAGVGGRQDYANGSIIAMASYPTFDNRWFEAGLSATQVPADLPDLIDGTPIDPDPSILVNRAIQGRYNLGSTFKPFTAFAALNTGLISAGDYYQDTGSLHACESVDQDRCDVGPRALRVQERHLRRHAAAVPVRQRSTSRTRWRCRPTRSSTASARLIMVRNDFKPVLQEQVRAVRFRLRHRHRAAVRVRRHRARPGAQGASTPTSA